MCLRAGSADRMEIMQGGQLGAKVVAGFIRGKTQFKHAALACNSIYTESMVLKLKCSSKIVTLNELRNNNKER